MYAARKIPQTLVYGIRQARAALEQAPVEQVQQVVQNEQNGRLVRRMPIGNFVAASCSHHLAVTTISNIAQDIINHIGHEKLTEITNAYIDECLPEVMPNFGMLSGDDLNQDPMDMNRILLECQQEQAIYEDKRHKGYHSDISRQQKNLDDSYSSVDFNSDKDKFEDVTGRSQTFLQITDLLKSFKSWVLSLLDRCAAWARSIMDEYTTAKTFTDKRTLEYSFYGVFFAAAYSCDIVLLDRFKSPILTNAFRQSVLQMTADFDFFEKH